jgi:phage/plasmid-like protein (TIGR03299 family)
MVENMFSVQKRPWHGLGVILQDAPTTEDAIKHAGLDWRVKLEPIYTADGARVPDSMVTRRESDKRILGTVGKGYGILQNADAFKFFDPFLARGEASLESAGSLRGGKTVWVLAKLNRRPLEVTPGDAVEKFLLLSNGHDGLTAVRVGFTPVRVVCNNTLQASHANGESQLIRIFHSARVNETVDAVRDIVNAADARFEATAEQYQFLARRELDLENLKDYVRSVLYPNVELDDMGERQAANLGRITAQIVNLHDAGQGANLARGTYWGAYNAMTEYLTHKAGKDDERRLTSLWFGNSKAVNVRALEIATAMAQVA